MKSLEYEQFMIRADGLQQEVKDARDEGRKYQALAERRQLEKVELEALVRDKQEEIDRLDDELFKLKELAKRHRDEEIANSRVIDVLNQELDELRRREFGSCIKRNSINLTSEQNSKLVVELEHELKKAKYTIRELKEQSEELRAELLTTRLEEGRSLLKEGQATSLADEMGSLTEDQLRTALKEQQDVNAKLRSYIDGILLNILEKSPNLLEVKPK
jgi:Rab11 family-interacting protein 3/4